MTTKSYRMKEQDAALSSLNVAIDALDIAREISGSALVNDSLDSVIILLTIIRVRLPLSTHVGRLLANVHRTR